jgi:hypothetical protein
MEVISISFDLSIGRLTVKATTASGVGPFTRNVPHTAGILVQEKLCDQVVAICQAGMRRAIPGTVPIDIDATNQIALDQSAGLPAATLGGAVSAAASIGPSPTAAPKKAAPKAGAKKAAPKAAPKKAAPKGVPKKSSKAAPMRAAAKAAPIKQATKPGRNKAKTKKATTNTARKNAAPKSGSGGKTTRKRS